MLDFINQNNPIKFFIAFAIVLALIALAAWLVRRFSANRLSGGARGRQPRLAVIDAASVDGRRRLVLIRRDNVEHLMMIGGPNDVIIEPNIVRATAARDIGRDMGMGREAFRPAAPEARQETRLDTRQAPPGEGNGNWPLQPAVEPPPPAPVQPPSPRGYRPPVTDEPWVAPEPPAPPAREPNLRARPADSISGNLTNMATEFNARLSPDLDLPSPPPPRPMPAREPPAVAPPSPPPVPAQTDRNLAEMAQRLEAALRRPGAPDVHPPVTDPLAASVPPPNPPPKPPEPLRETRIEPRADVAPEHRAETKPAQGKNPFDSLEEEMASLLGRQPGKT